MIEKADGDERNKLWYSVRLLIRHPDIDPDRITSLLRLTPHLSAVAGSTRKNPAGSVLSGVHRHSVWSHSFRVEGDRRFFSHVTKLVDKLEAKKDFLNEIERGGGTICLIIDLPGDANIGSILSWRDMARLGALRIDLGIEVFPELN